MDLRQLEYFQAVAKLNNVTRAAAQLHISQSTVTVAIQKLEEELGVVLFDRKQKQISLTPEGQVFLFSTADILTRVHDAVTDLQQYRQLQKGTVKVGIPPMIGSFLFPKILADFKVLYPNLQLIPVEEGSFTIRQLLERGELDLGIVNLYQPSPLLETLAMTREQFVVCLPPGHPLAGKRSIALAQLRDEPFILFKEGAYNRMLILEECQKHGFAPHIILSTDQIETMKGLVAAGVGIAFLVEAIASKCKEFVTVPLEEPIYLDFGLAWRKDRYFSKAAQAFMLFITDLIGPAKSMHK